MAVSRALMSDAMVAICASRAATSRFPIVAADAPRNKAERERNFALIWTMLKVGELVKLSGLKAGWAWRFYHFKGLLYTFCVAVHVRSYSRSFLEEWYFCPFFTTPDDPSVVISKLNAVARTQFHIGKMTCSAVFLGARSGRLTITSNSESRS